ncbi:MerR family transcriptional regulator [Phyllobacterium sp. 21LDTY02-6]|jgi:DNA-binding transcriptional MerR regulator|uniref:MerR family transcriptional regulator n=1 Tax=unclassified Phyllobacterium TaxID=2638441 RepID=UPI0020227225|nr:MULTISPECIES: MerR family transcriptional regulator [unclassified Phyllobacterium]MCO4319663.1 MerR family transcriptional regulator [Phyllobacterium sp. 21LDTY02-6]MCX8280406.1 MerR family transcriptional regulator [Phyllobacterium sp. 0TCS1.6C]MCX8295145.1 MerR family transcriptional regulator [Phyllobacterium sp. 0TCS1.6A]
MDKSPDAFRTISEVAEDLDLPQHVLRFWETRFTHIKPMKRGGGRRYYRPLDVDLLKGIRHLLYDQGYTIKGVQRLLRENGTQFIIALGSGDTAAAEAITQQKQAAARQEEEQNRADADEEAAVMGGPRPAPQRRLFGLMKGDDDGPIAADSKRLSKDNRALLQETLFDLLECKRLLDQVR